MGNNDELTSQLGLALVHCQSSGILNTLSEQLKIIQCRIQDLNSHVATPDSEKRPRPEFDSDGAFTKELEIWIDEMDYKLPKLTTFILPV